MELRRFLAYLRITFVKGAQVLQAKGMLLDRNEMQPPAARGILPPRLPGGEEIEAEAEAGLDDGEALAPGPALRQAVAGEEDVARLCQAAAGAVIDVGERRRPGRAVCGELGPGGNQSCGAHAAILRQIFVLPFAHEQ